MSQVSSLDDPPSSAGSRVQDTAALTRYVSTKGLSQKFKEDLEFVLEYFENQSGWSGMAYDLGLEDGSYRRIHTAVLKLYTCNEENEVPWFIQANRTDPKLLYPTQHELQALKCTTFEGSRLRSMLDKLDAVIYSHPSPDPFSDPPSPTGSDDSSLDNSQLALVLSNTGRMFQRALANLPGGVDFQTRMGLSDLRKSKLARSLTETSDSSGEPKDVQRSVENLSQFVRCVTTVLSGTPLEFNDEGDIV